MPNARGPVRSTLSWALYDVATSAFLAVVPTLLFPLYFRGHLDGSPLADLRWGLLAALTYALSGIAAPWLGAHTDRAGGAGNRRLSLLLALTAMLVVATAGLALPGPGQWLLAAAAFLVAQTAYTLAMALYDSYLPDLAPAASSARVSGLGWAVGFIGGVAALLLARTMLAGGADLPAPGRFREVFVAIAALVAGVAACALWGLRGVGGSRDGLTAPVRPGPPQAAPGPALSALVHGGWTLPGGRPKGTLAAFLLASYLIQQGVVTVIYFAAVFLQGSHGASVEQLLQLSLLYHVLALPATLAFGWLADRTSHRIAQGLGLSIWLVALLTMIFGRGAWVPSAVVVELALVLGSTQALLRSQLARLVPLHRASELFGFNALAGRLSAAFGPLLFGVVATATGSQRLALIPALACLVAGGALLLRLPEERPLSEERAPEVTEERLSPSYARSSDRRRRRSPGR